MTENPNHEELDTEIRQLKLIRKKLDSQIADR